MDSTERAAEPPNGKITTSELSLFSGRASRLADEWRRTRYRPAIPTGAVRQRRDPTGFTERIRGESVIMQTPVLRRCSITTRSWNDDHDRHAIERRPAHPAGCPSSDMHARIHRRRARAIPPLIDACSRRPAPSAWFRRPAQRPDPGLLRGPGGTYAHLCSSTTFASTDRACHRFARRRRIRSRRAWTKHRRRGADLASYKSASQGRSTRPSEEGSRCRGRWHPHDD